MLLGIMLKGTHKGCLGLDCCLLHSRGGVSIGGMGAIAPTVFSENLIDAEFLHPQFKRRIESWNQNEIAPTVCNS